MQQFRKNLGKVSLTAEGVWDVKSKYDVLSIVYDEHTQHGFISKQPVPIGVDLYNSEYWMPLNVSGYTDSNIIILNKKTSDASIETYTLEKAVKSIVSVGRKPGCILGFYNSNANRLDISGRWEIWQFNSTTISEWEDLNNWQNIYYNYNQFVGWYRNEEQLKINNPYPEIGCYAYVGNILNEAVVYRCEIKHKWTETIQHAWDYIKVMIDGTVTVGENGNWHNNGEDTGIPANIKGDPGISPFIRYNTTKNKLEYSYDKNVWYECSDYISTWFRWNATSGDTQADNVGRIQISRDKVNWTNLSGDIVNNLHISRYIGVDETLPTSGIAEGTIYAKGPYYAEGDTLNNNPIYRLWVYAWKGNTLAWQDNGEFTSISAGVVQETGNSETEVMSQKAVTEKLSKIGSNLILESSGKIDIKENNPNGTVRYNYSFIANKAYTINIVPDEGTVYTYMKFHYVDGTSNDYLNTGSYSFIPSKDILYFEVIYSAEMTANIIDISIVGSKDVINYAPKYSQFNGVFRKFGMIESVEFLSQNKSVRIKESRGAWVFGFKIDINNSPFKVGDSLCVGFKNIILNEGSGIINFACYDKNETRVSALVSANLATSELLSLTLDVVTNTKYIVAFIQGSTKLDAILGECILIEGNTIKDNYKYSRNILGDDNILAINYAPYYPNFKRALLSNDMNVSIKSNNNAIIRSDNGAKVFGFQVKLKDTPFLEGDLITARVKDVVLNSGSGYLMLLFYDSNETRLGALNAINITTSDYLELHKEIPQNTDLIVVRFQSQDALEAEVGEFIFTKDNVKGDNIQWIRNEIVSGGVSSSTNQTIYVNGDLGDDVNNGTKQMPMKTLSAAINKAGINANIVLIGNVYDSLNIKENDNQKSIRIVGEQGIVNRIILGNKIATATLVQEDVYQYNIDSFPSESTSYCLWQHDIADSSTAISESDKHPLQRGKIHRLDSTKLSRVSSIDAVKSSSRPVFFYDYSNKVLYFRVVSGSVLANNPIYMPTPNAAIYGNDGSVKVEMVNIESWYSNFDLSNCNGGFLTECAAKFGVNGGFSWKDCNGLQLIRCEACGTHDYDNNYGDGFSVGSTISEPTTVKCATAVMYDCWSHDNHDDGYSDHLNNETTIDGGLFEYNDGGVTTSYGSKDIVRNVYARNNTEAGITVYGGSAEGTESFVSNCICENNSPYNFSVVNGGSRKTKGTFVNCISINAENTGYYASGSNVEMTVINCYDNGSPNAKSANVSSKNSNIV